jgi:ribose transport system ATP-binding protein
MSAVEATPVEAHTREAIAELRSGASTPILRLEAVTKVYGPVVALSDVTLDVLPGQVHAIVGENGAGKSTLINVASGTVIATSGTIVLDGQPVAHPTPAAMRDRGIAVVHQHPALAPDLTVRENVALGRDGRLPERGALLMALAEVASGGMGIDPDDKLSDLNIAQWHVVEITKAMLLKPRILVLDEPTEPFGRGETERLFSLMRGLTAKGVAVVYISHRLNEVLAIADVVTVLRDGKLIATMPRHSVREEDIVAKIAGRTMDRLFPEKRVHPGEVRLSLRELSGAGFKSVSFDLRGGTIVGLAGIEGQGQRPFLRAVAGLDKARSGTIHCDGNRVPTGDRVEALRHGIGFVTDDRHAEGLFGGLPLSENLSVPVLAEMTRSWLISPSREAAMAEAAVIRFSIKCPGIHATPRQLSGGNQQNLQGVAGVERRRGRGAGAVFGCPGAPGPV